MKKKKKKKKKKKEKKNKTKKRVYHEENDKICKIDMVEISKNKRLKIERKKHTQLT